nr:hypothetical protein [Nanoarchaeum sp.]
MIFALLVPYISMLIGLYLFKNAWLAFLIYHILIISVLAYNKKLKSWKLMFKGFNLKLTIYSIVFGLLGGVILYFLAPYADLKSNITPILISLGLSGTLWLTFVIYHSLVNPWFEESYWRGYLGSSKKGLIATDFIFSGYHLLVLAIFLNWYWLILAFILLTLAAWFWRQLARKNKGLLIPILSHMAADASIMIVVYLLSN